MKALKSALRPLWWAAARRAARAYVAGDTVLDALRLCRRWRARHVLATLGYWNAAGERAEDVARQNHLCLAALERFLPDGYLSLKLGALEYRDDLLHPMLLHAARCGFRVHFDSLGPETIDRTNATIERARRTHADLGCTLPGRWHRSVDDVDWANENDLVVRVVKGQWADPDDPALDASDGFRAVIDHLAGRAKRVAVATHDVPLARDAIARLRRAGTPVDWELLHGLPLRRALVWARREAIPVRIYVPYGASFLPYSIDDVRRHPQVVLWLARDALGG